MENPRTPNLVVHRSASKGEHKVDGIFLVANHFKATPDIVWFEYMISTTDDNQINKEVIFNFCRNFSASGANPGGPRLAFYGGGSLFTSQSLSDEAISTLQSNLNKSTQEEKPATSSSKKRPSKRGKHFPGQVAPSFQVKRKDIASAHEVLNAIPRKAADESCCQQIIKSFSDDEFSIHVGGGVYFFPGIHWIFRTTKSGLTLITDILMMRSVSNSCSLSKVSLVGTCEQAESALKNLEIRNGTHLDEYKIGLNETTDGSDCLLEIQPYTEPHLSFTQVSEFQRKCIEVLKKFTRSDCDKDPLLSACGVSDDKDPLLSTFGVSIDKSMISVKGRILEAPALLFGDNIEHTPINGQWTYDNHKLHTGAKIGNWAVINFSSSSNTSEFCEKFIAHAVAKGITMKQHVVELNEDKEKKSLSASHRVEGIFKLLMEKLRILPVNAEKSKSIFASVLPGLRDPSLDFLLCILDKQSSDIYGPLMRKCHVEVGIIAHCVAIDGEIDDRFLNNLVLKTNLKLGGTNFTIAKESLVSKVRLNSTMIVGMSIWHGLGSGSDIPTPSIAAGVVSAYTPASSKVFFSEHKASVRAQSSGIKMINSLYRPTKNGGDAGIFRELLEFFSKIYDTRTLPKRIILFRTGVSESQQNAILKIELHDIRKAISHILKEEDKMPKFTVIAVETNSCTKLFKGDSNDGDHSQQDVPAGTVVDSEIVHPTAIEFYLCSRNGTTGASCPTRYTVLLNESKWTSDELQKIVHVLSYSYETSTALIPEVAPIRYAKRAASHMHQVMMAEDTCVQDSEDVMKFKALIPKDPIQDVNCVNFSTPQLPRLRRNVQDSFFFC